MGRTGKKNPRLAEDWILWADEESIIKIIVNTYKFAKEYGEGVNRMYKSQINIY